MSLILPDGYILETIGPFRGTMNDASIAAKVVETHDELLEWCAGEGQMILDRGFRDIVETFEQLGYEARMPDFLRKGEKQHTTVASNESRLCTKTRWIVESYHSRIKKWRFLDDRIHNSMIPKVKVGLSIDSYFGAI